jgi:hypothetical protein
MADAERINILKGKSENIKNLVNLAWQISTGEADIKDKVVIGSSQSGRGEEFNITGKWTKKSVDVSKKAEMIKRLTVFAMIYGSCEHKYIPLLYMMLNTIENLEALDESEYAAIYNRYKSASNPSIMDFIFATQPSTINKAAQYVPPTGADVASQSKMENKVLKTVEDNVGVQVEHINKLNQTIQELQTQISDMKQREAVAYSQTGDDLATKIAGLVTDAIKPKKN